MLRWGMWLPCEVLPWINSKPPMRWTGTRATWLILQGGTCAEWGESFLFLGLFWLGDRALCLSKIEAGTVRAYNLMQLCSKSKSSTSNSHLLYQFPCPPHTGTPSMFWFMETNHWKDRHSSHLSVDQLHLLNLVGNGSLEAWLTYLTSFWATYTKLSRCLMCYVVKWHSVPKQLEHLFVCLYVF